MKDAYRMFKAMADGNRLKVMLMLMESDMCVGDISERLKMSQPAVSHHLSQLKGVNLVKTERNGKQIVYSINRNMMDDLLEYLSQRFKGEAHEK